MSFTLLDAENVVIDVMHLPFKFFVTLEKDVIYCGINNEILERFFRIKNNKPVTVFFRKDDRPIDKWPLVDFDITDENESKIHFIDYQGHYEKIEDAMFECVSNDEKDQLPSYRCLFSKKN
jgi:hypothetical protein